MNRKTIFSAAALVTAFGLATTAVPAAAKDDMMMKRAQAADTDKDGMISKEEYLAQAAKMWDDKMAAIMKMPAAQQAKMAKDNKMTFDGYFAFWKLSGGQ